MQQLTVSFLNAMGDLNGVSKSTASKVCSAIASLNGHYIRFPHTNEELRIRIIVCGWPTSAPMFLITGI